MARYENRPIKKLTNIKRSDMIRDRGVKNIVHYVSPIFKNLPSDLYDSDRLEYMVWKVGSRFYKLAHEFYGDSRLWWIIAYFNRKPTDSHVQIGEVVYIPLDWETILDSVQSARYDIFPDYKTEDSRYEGR